MAETRLGDIIDYLASSFVLDSEVQANHVTIHDGPPAVDVSGSCLFIGAGGEEYSDENSVEQTWEYLGGFPPTRRENLQIMCALRVNEGNQIEMKLVRDKALLVFSSLASSVRASKDAVSGNGLVIALQVEGFTLRQTQTQEGATAVITFMISSTGHV